MFYQRTCLAYRDGDLHSLFVPRFAVFPAENTYNMERAHAELIGAKPYPVGQIIRKDLHEHVLISSEPFSSRSQTEPPHVQVTLIRLVLVVFCRTQLPFLSLLRLQSPPEYSGC